VVSVAGWLNAVLVLGNFLSASYFVSKIYIWALIEEHYSKSKFACVLQWFSSHAGCLECTLLVFQADVMTGLAASVNM